MDIVLAEGERLDDLQNGYWLIQQTQDFCYGIDAVLLSWFASVKKGERALDLCTGSGVIPLLLKAKTQGEEFYGLEIQQRSADTAKRSVALNHLEDCVHIVQGDVKEAVALFGAASFSVVTCNPPYMTGKHGLTNQQEAKTIARHEVLCTLEDVVSQSAALLQPKGRFYMVHRPFRLAEIMGVLMKYGLEPKRMQLVYPFVDREPNMVLIEALKGGRPRITVEKPLIVYDAPGQYSRQIHEIYGMDWQPGKGKKEPPQEK
jgi:tRNA1Val (adenine37-N6)-methyltransferase